MVECDRCEGHSTVFCHGCKLNLCAKCNEEQHKVPKFQKHVREQLVNNDQVDQQIGKCTEHNAFYSFYCDACDKFVCLEEYTYCFRTHNTSIRTLQSHFSNVLSTKLDAGRAQCNGIEINTNAKLASANKMLSDVEAKLSSAEKELNEGIDSLIKTIERCRESAQRVIQTQRKTDTGQIKEFITSMQKHLHMLQKTHQDIDQVLKKENQPEFVLVRDGEAALKVLHTLEVAVRSSVEPKPYSLTTANYKLPFSNLQSFTKQMLDTTTKGKQKMNDELEPTDVDLKKNGVYEITQELPIVRNGNGTYSMDLLPTHIGPTRIEPTRIEPTHIGPTRIGSTCIGPTEYAFIVDDALVKYESTTYPLITLLPLIRKCCIPFSKADPSKCFLVSALDHAFYFGSSLAILVQLANANGQIIAYGGDVVTVVLKLAYSQLILAPIDHRNGTFSAQTTLDFYGRFEVHIVSQLVKSWKFKFIQEDMQQNTNKGEPICF